MLETALAAQYIPGSNMKGDVEGANWIFLLPNFEFERVFCIGLPTVSTLTTLSRFSKHVYVVCVNHKELEEFIVLREQSELSNLQAIVVSQLRHMPIKNGSVELILIADQSGIDQSNEKSVFLELRRLGCPHLLIYFEVNKIDFLSSGKAKLAIDANSFGQNQLFWLTPLNGEAHTAVPSGDLGTKSYFLDNNLYSPEASLAPLKQIKRFLKTKRAGQNISELQELPNGKDSKDIPRKVNAFVRSATVGIEQGIKDVQRHLIKRNQFISRFGVLVGENQSEFSHQPPLYLRSLASEWGVDLDDYRWGLSARGDYSSRKVLIYLFSGQNGKLKNPEPEYIVKLVRDPIYNYRLENEYRALSLLKKSDESIRRAVPKIGFFGYHADLAVIGEKMIVGDEFRQKTDLTETCSYMHNAVNWLIHLGAVTVNKSLVSAEQAAKILDNLYSRFFEIYQISPEHKSFLVKQIEKIQNFPGAFPLVFQHGDPGTWNALITESGKVAFLDWESAERNGMPLWDLFYFLRSYIMGAARSKGIGDRIQAIVQLLLTHSPYSQLYVDSTETYCHQTGLSGSLTEPIFYTCWMHRALKEATRLTPGKVGDGHYVNLLRLFIEYRESEVLGQLFS